MICSEVEITVRFLRTRGNKGILYVYRKEKLWCYLRSRQIAEFLKEYGYQSERLEDMLMRLTTRIGCYSAGTLEFPHEIGVFLGYPLSDVRGFLEDEGRNCAYVGYWKVYDNVHSKIRLFQRYDEHRELAGLA